MRVGEARQAAILLLLNGAVLATHAMLARAAAAHGVHPLLYALAGAAGAALALGAGRAAMRSGLAFDRTLSLYGLVAGLISVALPQALIYGAAAHVSAGVASLAYAFPTPLTFALAALFGLERPSLGRTIGIGIALAGALLLAVSRSGSFAGEGSWVALALLAPIAIAGGNIFRARCWPPGRTPLDLAVAMSAGAALWLLVGTLALDRASLTVLAPGGGIYLALAAAVATGGNLIYFQLQRIGGIVSFSQIGYVGAVLGLAGGALLLGERQPAATWIAAAIIAAGVGVSEMAKRRAEAISRPPPSQQATPRTR